MSNVLRIGNREISYEQAKEMLFPELIPQKGNEAILAEHPHERPAIKSQAREQVEIAAEKEGSQRLEARRTLNIEQEECS